MLKCCIYYYYASIEPYQQSHYPRIFYFSFSLFKLFFFLLKKKKKKFSLFVHTTITLPLTFPVPLCYTPTVTLHHYLFLIF